MTQFFSDNINEIQFMGAYGNASLGEAVIAAFPTMAAGDTIDLMKIPGGARIRSGQLVIATAITTATLAIGVRYADGTSTGGTTGTAVLSGTGAAITTSLAPQLLNFVPFANDVDTIVYATAVVAGVPGANIAFALQLNYEASGTK